MPSEPTQTIVWTAVPGGVSGSNLLLSVHVSPRLVGPAATATLSAFPDWVSWPAGVPALAVTIGQGASAVTVPATVTSTGLSTSLWSQLFPTSTPVFSYVPDDNSGTSFRSFPVSAVHDFIKDQYTELATAGTAYPTGSVNTDLPPAVPFDRLVAVQLDMGTMDSFSAWHEDSLNPRSGIAGIAPPPPPTPPGPPGPFGRVTKADPGYPYTPGNLTATQYNLFLLEQFHNRASTTPTIPPLGQRPVPDWFPLSGGVSKSPVVMDVAPVTEPSLDMHQVLTSLLQYPGLLQQLGLVITLAVPLSSVSPGLYGTTVVQVAPTGWTPKLPPASATVNVSPQTQCTLSATTFAAALSPDLVQPAPLVNGMVNVSGANFSVTEFDPDTCGLRVLAFAKTLVNANGGADSKQHSPASLVAPDTPTSFAAPALKSDGLSLVQFGRAAEIATLLTEHGPKFESAITANTPPVLYAEDLATGYRIDVYDETTGKWYSLCQRTGTYDFASSTVHITDEGMVTAAATAPPKDSGGTTQVDTMYLHEALFHWKGWSLVAPLPATGLANDEQNSTTAGTGSPPGPDFNLNVTFTPTKGTLPKLRFGRSYRFRLRAVDIGGTGLGPTDPSPTDFSTSTAPVLYGRFDPVNCPVVLYREPRTPGEGLETLVIRSNYNTSATVSCERHLAPHKTSEQMSEHHGMWDRPVSLLTPNGMASSAYPTIKKYDEGNYANGGTPDPNNAGAPYYIEAKLAVPYLPDPISRGVAFVGLPGAVGTTIPGVSGPVVTADFNPPALEGWPAAQTVLLVVEEGTGAPAWSASQRTLTVQLPQAAIVTVSYSAYLNATDLNLMGVWGWVTGSGNLNAAELAVAQEQAVAGQNWMMTPYREMTLVHAVQQPLVAPRFNNLTVQRSIGETFAVLADALTVDIPSSAKVDVTATWTDTIDNVNTAGPVSVTSTAQPFEFQMPYEPSGKAVALDNAQEFHDTKYHQVAYTASASTRFSEYFEQTSSVTLTGTTTETLASGGVAPGTVRVTAVVNGTKVTYAESTTTAPAAPNHDYVVNYSAGTIARSASSSIPSGATVTVSFVAGSITRQSTEVQTPVAVNVPSTARPVAPDIAYIVPSFGWSSSSTKGNVTSKRGGNGLRVYMNRPWFSSGNGEMLAAVLYANGSIGPGMDQYVTTAGQDPMWNSTAVGQPQASEFVLAGAPAGSRTTGLTLAEADTTKSADFLVTVAPHAVSYDSERQMWYSDLEINLGTSYMPFIKLALARYQPISLPGVELSRVVMAQFAQLMPDRTASVVYAAAGATSATVSVSGITYMPDTSSAQYSAPPVLTVTVQAPSATQLSGDLGWTTVGSPVTLVASKPGGLTTWTGTVTLPGPQGKSPYRLLVSEYEVHGGPNGTTTKRLVYADGILI